MDTDLIRAVSGCVDIPVIACGGAGNPDHITAAAQAGAAAVAAASIFHYRKYPIPSVRDSLIASGVEVRRS